VLVEIGPGRTLTTLARQHPRCGDAVAVSTLPHAVDDTSDLAVALTAAGRLWAAGVAVDLAALHHGEIRRRVPLPSYPFQGQRYLVEAPADAPAPTGAAIVAPEPPRDDDTPRYVPPATPRQEAVCTVFAELLGLARVGVHDNFFDLGGDSLIALQVTGRLRGAYPVALTVRELFGAPTPGRLAALLDQKLADAPVSVPPERER
jgi:phthiocerol/phenolphthiocerol synthesis type-I polyketide synthase E